MAAQTSTLIRNPSQEAVWKEKRPRSRLLESWFNQSWKLLALPLLFFIAIPLFSILTRTTLSNLLTNLNQAQVVQAVQLSLTSSMITTLVTIALGTPVALLLSQRRNFFHRIADTLIDLPTVLPPAVAGIALLMAFGRKGLFGDWLTTAGINLPFTTAAVIMAQTFVAAPLFVKAATLGFAGIDPELKQAAALDGANRRETFRYVILPLTWKALLSGSVMTWARALGEFGATITFAGNFPGRTQTMPLAIYLGFEIDLNVAITLSIILIGFSFLFLMIVKGLLHYKMDDCVAESD